MPAFTRQPQRLFALALFLCLALVGGFIVAPPSISQADTTTAISLTAANVAVTENFNTLVNTGTGTLAANTPPGWGFAETGANANTIYTAGTGSSNAGDTYSFGPAGNSDRAFGGLRSGNLIPSVGARFVNNTGAVITALAVSYTGEQWRLGALNRADRLDFQISVNATSLTTGNFVDVDALDFTAPTTTGTVGALDGNAAANRTAVSSTITGLNIPNGGEFFIRWNDLDAPGADDGLAIDDFSITANPGGGPVNQPVVTNCPGTLMTAQGVAASTNVSASDADGVVTSAILSAPVTGITLNNFIPATAPGGTASATLNVAASAPAGSFPVVIRWSNNDPTPQTADCTVTVTVGAAAQITRINAIQGTGAQSPVVGQMVTVDAVVTGIKNGSGFFLQEEDADADADPNTSEGIFVFTGSAIPAQVVIGNRLRLTGTVTEFVPTQDINQPSITQLTSATNITVMATAQPLPAPVVITSEIASTPSSFEPTLPIRFERLECMRVQVPSLTVTAPSLGSVSEPNATSTTSGIFQGVVTGAPRPFREPGIQAPDPAPSGSIPPIPRFDGNPERIAVESNRQPGNTPLAVTTGAVVTNLVGPLDYSFRTFTILPDAATPPTVTGNISAIPVPAPGVNELTVASANMQRFFDDVNDPAIGEPVLTTTAFNNRLNKASLLIRNILQTPDVIGFQEVENLSTLQRLATKVNDDAVAAAQPNPNYQAFLIEGNDVGGIDVGFLVKTARVTVVSVTQFGKNDTFTNPSDGGQDILNDRPPLVLEATIGSYAFTVIDNHLRSLNDVDDPVAGLRVRAKRRAQAEFLANLIQSRQIANPAERIIAVGDFNAFQFNDGLVDSLGTIKGTPAPADQVVASSPDLVNPDLTNLLELDDPAERYSFVFGGNAQSLDHALVTGNFLRDFARINHGRVNADFPEGPLFRNDPNRPERISDHDPLVVAFNVNNAVLANDQVTLAILPGGAVMTGDPGTAQPAPYAGRFTATLRLTNTGTQRLTNLSLRLQELSKTAGPDLDPMRPNRLQSSDGYTGLNGTVATSAVQSVTGVTLDPGQFVDVPIRIDLGSIQRFRLLFNVFANVSPVANLQPRQTARVLQFALNRDAVKAFECDPLSKTITAVLPKAEPARAERSATAAALRARR
jgi:hypothetical protein